MHFFWFSAYIFLFHSIYTTQLLQISVQRQEFAQSASADCKMCFFQCCNPTNLSALRFKDKCSFMIGVNFNIAECIRHNNQPHRIVCMLKQYIHRENILFHGNTTQVTVQLLLLNASRGVKILRSMLHGIDWKQPFEFQKMLVIAI